MSVSKMAGTVGALQTEELLQANRSDKTEKTENYGRTIGEPKLSDKAAKYYEELKKKFSNLDFILVSKDQKEMAKAQASKYANPNRMVVLIDEEKIERMAEDENYRKQYENIIKTGANGMSQMAKKLMESGVKVAGYGMQIKDGRASFFAAVDKSFADQRARQQKRIEEKKAAKKAEAKKTEKKEAKEKLEEHRKERSEKAGEDEDIWNSDKYEIFSASSVEELMQKIEDYNLSCLSDRLQTQQELQVGQSIDYSV